MKHLLSHVLVERNDVNDEIHIILDDVLLWLKEMNDKMMLIEEVIAPNLALSFINLVNHMEIDVYASNST